MISSVSSQDSYYSILQQLQQSQKSQQSQGMGSTPSFDDLLSKLDSNGDDGLSIDELSISEEAFAKADANSDGIIDQTEFEDGGSTIIGDDLKAQGNGPPMGPPPGGGGEPSFEEVLSQWDANGDGVLSIDELGASEEAFAEADTNSDGAIDRDEFDSGSNKIIGDDLRAQGGIPSIPTESVTKTDTTSTSSTGSLTATSAYQYIQNLLQNNASENDIYSLLSSLAGNLNLVA